MDTETGGLHDKPFKDKNGNLKPACAITSIAVLVIDCNSLEVIEKYETYVKRYDDATYDPIALQITGITFDILQKKGKEPYIAAKEVLDIINKYSPNKHPKFKPIIVGQNIKFDIGMLTTFFQRFLKVDFSNLFQEESFDTIRLAQLKHFQGLQDCDLKFNLQSICDRENIPLFDAHGALADTKATAQLFIKFAKALKSENNSEDGNRDKRYRDQFQF